MGSCASKTSYLAAVAQYACTFGRAYSGVVDCAAGTGSVELRRYPLEHPFAQLQGSDNIIAFTTQRYKSQPLIVRRAPLSRRLGFGLAVQGPGDCHALFALSPAYVAGACMCFLSQQWAAHVPDHALRRDVIGKVRGWCKFIDAGMLTCSTQLLNKQVLIVRLLCRGPGAGAEVTAGGVFSDLLRLAAYLGAPS